MAQHNHRSSRSHAENELWLNTPALARRPQAQGQVLEQSAYQTTSRQISTYPSGSTADSRIPAISTSSDLNKPLPPSPSSSGKYRKPASLRGLLRHESSSQVDTTHLRPEPYQSSQRHSTALNVDTYGHHCHNYSRSMPSSPYDLSYSSYQDPATPPRAHSSASGHSDALQYQAYSVSPPSQSSGLYQQRAVSMNTYFDTATQPRSRTFPDTTSNSTARATISSRHRPHTTWLSPTEPFADVSQFHLFAEAMTGLPNYSEPFSPTGPPQLQGSLFARRNVNDIIPLPLQHAQQSSHTPHTRRPQREQRDDWQNFEPPPLVSSRAAPALNHSLGVPNPPLDSYQQWQPPPQMDAVNAELEMLGLNDPQGSDDELPDYQQSQAEMAAKKRREASARAKELEARWRGTRR
ncbi:hypothetical protein DDE82_005855 [Stemphylium lycopersici]|uniref:Uncharacterized protein n=1 Tax=Stemphylium lycopersici TaxID=183478 RepID=A0A364N452_STELY|nr:hypothetical protein TW65_01612 [Stemphylium lycopersici]RAR02459.1 hypothetical protein DDE82_005855 [Stemphylium lycopersici]RAR11464.1 hypothetical protein DDE83_004500 [Stemphylium lycopersici]